MFRPLARCYAAQRPLTRCLATATELPTKQAAALPLDAAAQQKQRNTKNPLVRIRDGYKTFKPITPGLRHVKMVVNPHLWRGKPVKLLTTPLRKSGGRNNTGKIAVRSRGGGHKRRLRDVDFTRNATGPHDVIRIEYDPGRSAHIALIKTRSKSNPQPWSYILACEGLRAGDVVTSFRQGIPNGLVKGYRDDKTGGAIKFAEVPQVAEAPKAMEVSSEDPSDPSSPESLETPGSSSDPMSSLLPASPAPASVDTTEMQLSLGNLLNLIIKPGNVLPVRLIPPGTTIHCISLKSNGPAKLVRSAGTWATVITHEEAGLYAHIRLQSGEVRKIRRDCCATIGKVSNSDWGGRVLGKAGRNRWLGRRPHVRGMAMNACDHPHGGGRGKSKGNVHPKSAWGWNTKGKRTRKPGPKGHKSANRMVVHERPRGRAVIAVLNK